MKILDIFAGRIEKPTAQEFMLAAGGAGESALTSVVLDYRKHRDDTVKERLAPQLWNAIEFAFGRDAELNVDLIDPETGTWVDKDGKGVDIELLNAMSTAFGESVNDILDRHPILSTIVCDVKADNRRPHMHRLAVEISECGVGHYLRVLSGHAKDSSGGLLLDPPGVSAPKKGRRIGWDKAFRPMGEGEY
jgi:hypothetical protein